MATQNKKTPAKTPAKPRKDEAPEAKTDAPEDGSSGQQPQAPRLVQPLRQESLKVLLQILDAAQITGSQARIILELRRELYMVAGVDISV
jgi:hypothetical protein